MEQYLRVLFIFLYFIGLFSFNAFTAETVCFPDARKTALIIIDMQPFFVKLNGVDETPENAVKIQQLMTAQTDALLAAQRHNIPILIVEYEESGETYSRLKNVIKNYENVKFFKKTSDSFLGNNITKEKIINYLRQNNIGTLIFAGINGDSCVKKSIYDALNGNCSVLTFSKGIADLSTYDFIYPYEGKFENIRSDCQNCKLVETSKLDVLIQIMTGSINLRN